VLKQCANIVAQFLDGIQILLYVSVTYINKLWCLCCNIYIEPNIFQTIWLFTRDFLRFSFRFLQHLNWTNSNLAKPLTINQTVRNISATLYQNYNKHSRCIRQSEMPANSTVQQYVLVNTKVSYPYLNAIPSVSFSYCTLWSHIKHTVCLCVSCYYICRKVTHNWCITFLFHLTLYV